MKRRQLVCALGSAPIFSLLSACGGSSDNVESATEASPAPESASSERTYTYGAILPDEATRAKIPVSYASAGDARDLPAASDLRSRGWLPPIGDQGSLGSCVAWTWAYATTSFLVAKAERTGGAQQIASPADLYAKLLALKTIACGEGTYPEDAKTILVNEGVVSERESPYSQSCARPSVSGSFRLTGAQPIHPFNEVLIKRELANERVVPLAMLVGKTFLGQRGGVIQSMGPNPYAHAVTIVGHDDSKQAFLIMNSWGTGWGEQGFAWVSYEAIRSAQPFAHSVAGASREPGQQQSGAVSFQDCVASYFDVYSQNSRALRFDYRLTEPVTILLSAFFFNDVLAVPVTARNYVAQQGYEYFGGFPANYQFPGGRYTLALRVRRKDGSEVVIHGNARV